MFVFDSDGCCNRMQTDCQIEQLVVQQKKNLLIEGIMPNMEKMLRLLSINRMPVYLTFA